MYQRLVIVLSVLAVAVTACSIPLLPSVPEIEVPELEVPEVEPPEVDMKEFDPSAFREWEQAILSTLAS